MERPAGSSQVDLLISHTDSTFYPLCVRFEHRRLCDKEYSSRVGGPSRRRRHGLLFLYCGPQFGLSLSQLKMSSEILKSTFTVIPHPFGRHGETRRRAEGEEDGERNQSTLLSCHYNDNDGELWGRCWWWTRRYRLQDRRKPNSQ